MKTEQSNTTPKRKLERVNIRSYKLQEFRTKKLETDGLRFVTSNENEIVKKYKVLLG